MSRRWRVVLLRAKGEILGEVEAPDARVPVTLDRTGNPCLYRRSGGDGRA
jgi:hypothetical protein